MRLIPLAVLTVAVALTACGDGDEITTPSRPPIGGVRVINALADTFAVDIKNIDQLQWSIVANNLNFRAGTEHQQLEAKARRFRVFAFNSTNPTIANVTQILHDTTITIPADRNVTLLLTGSARAKTVRFVMINDDPATPPAGQIAVRTVNASTGAIDAYYVNAVGDAISGSPSAANVGPLATSSYVNRATGNVAARVTSSGSTTANASLAGPNAPTGATGTAPAAGVNSAGSAFSVFYFPAGVTGSPQASVTAPSIVWFVDRVPTP